MLSYYRNFNDITMIMQNVLYSRDAQQLKALSCGAINSYKSIFSNFSGDNKNFLKISQFKKPI